MLPPHFHFATYDAAVDTPPLRCLLPPAAAFCRAFLIPPLRLPHYIC